MVDLPEQVLVLWNKNLQGSLGLSTPTRDQLILTRNLSELSWQNRFWKMIWLRSGFSLQKVRKSMEFSRQKFMRSGLSSLRRKTQKSSNLLLSLMPRRSVTCDLLIIIETLLRFCSLLSSKPADFELQYDPNFQEQQALGSSLSNCRRLFLRLEKEYGSPVPQKQLLKNSVFSLLSDENASNPLENTAKCTMLLSQLCSTFLKYRNFRVLLMSSGIKRISLREQEIISKVLSYLKIYWYRMMKEDTIFWYSSRRYRKIQPRIGPQKIFRELQRCYMKLRHIFSVKVFSRNPFYSLVSFCLLQEFSLSCSNLTNIQISSSTSLRMIVHSSMEIVCHPSSLYFSSFPQTEIKD